MTLEQYIDLLFDEFDFIDLRYLPEKGADAVYRPRAQIISKHELLKLIGNGEIEKIVNNSILYPCVGVNPRLASNRKDLLTIKNMIIDYDNCEPPKVAIENANIVCRRGNSWHLYYCFVPLPNTKDVRTLYSAYAKDLAQLTGADINATDPTRVVRMPYFRYRKNGVNEEGYKIEKLDTLRRRLDDTLGFVVLLKNKVLEGSELGVRKSFHYLSTGILGAGLDERKTEFLAISRFNESVSSEVMQRIEQFLLKYYAKKPVVEQGKGRSKFLYVFGCDCHGWGVPLERAVEMAKTVNREKCRPPESDEVVEYQIKCAYKYRKAQFGSYLHNFGTVDSADDAEKVSKQLEVVNALANLLSDWVFCFEAERLINTVNGLTFISQNQCDLYITNKLAMRVGLRHALLYGAVRVVDKIDYRPDVPERFYEVNGLSYYNTYRANHEMRRNCDREYAVSIFKRHIDYLTNTETEYRWLMAWLAYVVRNIGKKVMWAPLIISQKTGVGKSALIDLLKNIFGDWNVSEVSSYDLLSQYTDYMANKVLIASHEVELAEKEAMHRLKNLITEKTVRITQKYAKTYETTNCANFIFLSNRPDALKIDEEDRRLFVIYHRKEPKEQDYYRKLFHVIREGYGHIYDYLCNDCNISGFDPNRRPVVTEGKQLLISNSEGDLAQYLRKLEEENKSVFALDYFQTYDLYEYVHENAPQSLRRFCTMRTLQLWLAKQNYRNYTISVKEDSGWKKRCYWTKFLDEAGLRDALRSKYSVGDEEENV